MKYLVYILFLFITACGPLQVDTSTAKFAGSPTKPPQIYDIGSKIISPKDDMTMVYVPEGEFLMGLDNCEGEEYECPTQHIVILDAFWIDQTEVTYKQFKYFIDETGYVTDTEINGKGYIYNGIAWFLDSNANWRGNYGRSEKLINYDNLPVVNVSWNDASAYCKWAGRRLPTEAEWEKAAIGTRGLPYPWGAKEYSSNLANIADSNSNFSWSDKTINDGYDKLAPVGSFPDGISPYGALDMVGNASEWVMDWYSPFTSDTVTNPQGPENGKTKVLRGGGYSSDIHLIKIARRPYLPPYVSYDSLGFRCAQSP